MRAKQYLYAITKIEHERRSPQSLSACDERVVMA